MIREFKGKSVIALPQDYTVIDIETTGLDYEFCEIIEISALKVKDGAIVDRFSSLVRPEENVYIDFGTGKEERWFIDSFISELTGITNEMLQDAPAIEEIYESFINFLGNSILLGYNVNFDINFLYDAGAKLGYKFVNNYIDVMRIARKFYPDLAHHRLRDMVEYFKINVTTEHRALSDCETTDKCYQMMRSAILGAMTEEKFVDSFRHRSGDHHIDVSTIVSENKDFDETHPLYGQTVVFTGALSTMLRKDAMQLVVDVGGINANGVTKKTNFLVIGAEEFASSVKNGKTTKMKRAEELQLKGVDIQIISENVFFDMVENSR